MLNIHFTLPQVVGFLRNIAESEPERVGREDNGAGCVYVAEVDGKGTLRPICIIGQMFSDLGLLRLLLTDPSDLRYTSQHGACSVGGGFWDGLSDFGVTADSDAQHFMREVQSKQDEGLPWGVAFAAAVEARLVDGNDRLDAEQRDLDAKRQALAALFA